MLFKRWAANKGLVNLEPFGCSGYWTTVLQRELSTMAKPGQGKRRKLDTGEAELASAGPTAAGSSGDDPSGGLALSVEPHRETGVHSIAMDGKETAAT